MHTKEISINPTLLSLNGDEINEKFPTQNCHDVSTSIIQYLCCNNKPINLPVGSTICINNFIKSSNNVLFNESSEENLFLFNLGDNFHSFIIEKVIVENKFGYIIYQSWYLFFSLSWWLGKQSSPNEKECLYSDYNEPADAFYLKLRDDFGNGKILTKDEIAKFFFTIMLEPSQYRSNDRITVNYLAFKKHNDFHHNPCNTEIKNVARHLMINAVSHNNAIEPTKICTKEILGIYFSLK